MEIREWQEVGRVPVTVFHVNGEINVSTYEQLQERARASHAAGARDIALDLSEVTYISSAGIRALQSLFNLFRGSTPAESDEAIRKGLSDGTFRSPHVKLVNPQPRVMEVLKIAGVDMFLEIHHNLSDAAASF